MLYLINNNKGGKNFNTIAGEEIHWKALFKTSEDSLTSSVFSLLFYLPVEFFWSIIRGACFTSELPKHCGKLKGYEFWPRWPNEKKTYTEPDILVQFEEFDLIIEAKRYDYNQQYHSQWIEEANSYYGSEVNKNDKLYLLAIGGISYGDERATMLEEPNVAAETVVVKTRWNRLLGEIIRNQKEMAKTNVSLHSSSALLNILNDLVLSFRIHGFITADLLNTLPINLNIQTSYMPRSQELIKRRFQWQRFPNDFLSIKADSIKIISNYNEQNK